MNNRTEGNWYVCDKGRKSTVVDSDGFEIAWAMDGCETYNGESVRLRGSEEKEANAQLLAAAPELLDALIELRDAYQEFMGLPACKANAAIAKATWSAA